MPNAFVHYAFGVAIARSAGYRGRRAWFLGGGLAVLADVDVVTTVLNTGLMAVATPSDGTIATLSFVMGHRGFSHTLLAAALVTLATLAVTRKVAPTLLALACYGSHIVLDLITTWPVRPLAPFSGWRGELGILTIWDPLLTAVSLAYLASAFIAERSEGTLTRPRRAAAWFAQRRPERWNRAASATAAAFLVALLAAIGAKAAIAASTGSTFRDVEPVHLFQYTYLVRDGDYYVVGLTPFLFSPGQALTVPVLTLGANTTQADAQLVFDASKRLDCLAGFNWYSNPIWQISREGETARVEVRTAKAAATGLGEAGFALRFTYEGRAFNEAVLLEGGEPEPYSAKEITALARCP